MIKNFNAKAFGSVVAGSFLFALATIVTANVAYQDDATEDTDAQDLPGINIGSILPEKAPTALGIDAFDDLGENWEAWSDTTSTLVADLYEDKDLSDAERLEVVSKLRGKLSTIEKCLGDSKYASIQEPLRRLRRDLSFRLDLVDSLADIVNGRETGSAAVPEAVRSELIDSINYLDSYLGKVINGSPWRDYLKLEQLRDVVDSMLSDEAAMEVLDAAAEKLGDSFKDADLDQKQFARRFAFARVLDSLENYQLLLDPEVEADDVFADLVLGFVGAYENYAENRSRMDAYRIRKGLRLLDDLAPMAAGGVQSLFGQRYLNDNLRFAASEELLSYAVNQRQNNSGSIRDCILGATVTGCQVSQADITVDVQPSPDTAKFLLRINGVANSNTQGRKKPATIFTRGTHYFSGHKSVSFDGNRFDIGETRLWVNPNNCTTGIQTDLDCIPIVRGIAQKIARQEVDKTAAKAEQIAAYKLAKEVIPRFDREVEDRFRKTESDLDSKLYSTLRRSRLYPDSLRASSSDRDISIFSRTMGEMDLGAGTPPALSAPASGFMVQIHESLINNALDRLDLAGRSLTEAELKIELEDAISDLLGRPFAFKVQPPQEEVPEEEEPGLDDDAEDDGAEEAPGPQLIDPPELPVKAAQMISNSLSVVPVSFELQDGEDEGEDENEDEGGEAPITTFNFDSVDPIRVKLNDSGFTLLLRTGIQQDGKDDIPLQAITIPFMTEMRDGKLMVEAGKTKVDAIERTRFGAAAQINRILKDRLSRVRDIDLNSFELPIEGKASLTLSINELYNFNGWVVLSAARAASVSPPSLAPEYLPISP